MDYRAVWERKPVLRAVYSDIHRRILSHCTPGRILEIGGGSGNFKAFAPESVSCDIVSAPWLDVVCDAQRLPFLRGSFNNLVMLDVLHHLESPLLFLREAQRVLSPGGRLIFCEPAITPFSRIFYRLFHEEPFDMGADPLAATSISSDKNPWDSNQGIPTLLVSRYRQAAAKSVPELTLKSVDYFSFLAYPMSGGFKSWSLIPAEAARPLLAAEWAVHSLIGRLAAFRLLGVYERQNA
jgi:SAM-dependent methyltransferase